MCGRSALIAAQCANFPSGLQASSRLQRRTATSPRAPGLIPGLLPRPRGMTRPESRSAGVTLPRVVLSRLSAAAALAGRDLPETPPAVLVVLAAGPREHRALP